MQTNSNPNNHTQKSDSYKGLSWDRSQYEDLDHVACKGSKLEENPSLSLDDAFRKVHGIEVWSMDSGFAESYNQ